MTIDELLGAGKPMRVLISGSREWVDRAPIEDLVARLPAGSVVIHGACGCDTRFDPAKLRGADLLVDVAARQRGLDVHPYPAEWTRLDKAAGPIRNQQMLEEERPDVVVGFPLGDSPGTRGMLELAARAGVPTFVPSVVTSTAVCDSGPAGRGSSSSRGEPASTGRADRHPAGTPIVVPRLLTVGYQGWKPDEIRQVLSDLSVAVVVDVRANPWSQAPQWRRAELERLVVGGGVRYAWAGDLVGNPRSNRADESDRGGGILERFRTYVTDGQPSRLQRFASRLMRTDGTACLLCACEDAARCHRGVLVEELVRAGAVAAAGVHHLVRPAAAPKPNDGPDQGVLL